MSTPVAELPLNPSGPLAQAADRGLILSLHLFLFSLPLAYITAVREITLGLAAFFWLAAMVLRRRLLITRTPLDWPLLALLAVALLSLVWAINPAYTFKEIRGELFKGFLVYYLAAYALQSEERLRQTWLVLIAGNGLMVLYALWDFQHTGGVYSSYYIRARSLHSGYGSFGTYLITVFPFLVILTAFPLGKGVRAAWLGLLAVNLFCLYITFGRAMWLAAGLELVLLGIVLKKKKAVVILLILGVAAVWAIPRTVWFHGERLVAEEDGASRPVGGTAGDLIAIWKLAARHIQEDPFRGIGFGRHSFSEAFTDFRSRHQPLLWHAHNTLLNLTFQTGIQGLLVMLWLIGTVLYHTLRPPPAGETGVARWFSLAVGVMAAGFFVRNFFDDFFVDDNALLFWLLLGGAMGGLRKHGSTDKEAPVQP